MITATAPDDEGARDVEGYADVPVSARPGTVVVVRDPRTVQVGLAPDRAVVVTAPEGCHADRLAALLGALDGREPLSVVARRAGIDAAAFPAVARVLVGLARHGHLRLGAADPATGASADPRPAPVRRVHLLGTGQVSQVLRAPLSVNGCRVTTGPSPGIALDPARPPWHRRGPRPDLVVITDSVAVDPVVTSALVGSGQVHLHVYCRDGRVVVGPMVIPGRTPCLWCTDLYRADHDPGWPRVAAQLLRHAPGAGVPALTAAAALVLAEVSASREPDAPLQTVGATVEINPAEGLWRRLEWPAHPGCRCGAAPPGPLTGEVDVTPRPGGDL